MGGPFRRHDSRSQHWKADVSWNNRSNSPTRFVRLLMLALLTALFLAYFAVYLDQPSLFGLTDEDGAPHSRFLDLFVLPSLLPGMWGDGLHPVTLLDRLPILAGAALWLVCAWRIGRAWIHAGILGRASAPDRGWEDAVLVAGWQLLVGLAWLSSLVLILGLVGGLGSRWPLVATVVLSLAGAEWTARKRVGRSAGGDTSDLMRPGRPSRADGWGRGQLGSESGADGDGIVIDTQFARWLRRLLPVLVVMSAVVYLLGSMVPPWEFDVLEYHLQAPKEFYQQGAIRFNDHNVYANMPLGAEMHALAAMVLIGGDQGWWYGGLIGKTILGFFSWIMSAMVGSWMAKRGGRVAGWTAAGLTLANLGHAHEAMSGLIDMAMASYLVATILLLHAVIPPGGHPVTVRWESAIGLGILSGAAAACKYPGAVVVLLPAMVVAAGRCWRLVDGRAGLQLGAGMCFGWGVTAGAWLLKNTMLTGNPVYPMFGQWFGAPGLTADAIQRWNHAHSPFATTDHPFALEQVAHGVWRLFVHSPFLNPGTTFLAVIGCCLLLASKLRRRAGDPDRIPTLGLGWWMWVLVVWWCLTHRIDRFWLPALPLMAMHATWAARWVADRVSPSLALVLVVASQALALVQVSAGAGPVDNRFFVALSSIEREALDERRSSVVNPATAWVNRNLDSKDLVLCIGEVKAYLYRVPILYATCFNMPPGQPWLQGVPPHLQWEHLKSRGVTHVMVDWSEIDRYRSPGNYGFSAWPVPEEFDRMVQAGVLQRLETPFDPRDVDILRVATKRPQPGAGLGN